MKDRTVVVTGCSSGIGAAAVERFALAGASVIGVDRNRSTDSRLTQMVVGDLSTQGGVQEVIDELPSGIDALINNAGVAATLPWRVVMSINALAPRDLIRGLIPKFNPEPAVVTTASQTGGFWQMHFPQLKTFLTTDDWDEALDQWADHPGIETECYNLSKEAAIVGCGLAVLQGRPLGLRANTISPGTVATPLLPSFRDTIGADFIDGAATWTGRHCEPAEVADLMLFLASPASAWVNGADIPIDGGFSTFVFHNYVAPAMAQMNAPDADGSAPSPADSPAGTSGEDSAAEQPPAPADHDGAQPQDVQQEAS